MRQLLPEELVWLTAWGQRGTGTGGGVEGLVDGNIVKRRRVKANYPPRLDFRRRNTSDAQISSSRKVDTLA